MTFHKGSILRCRCWRHADVFTLGTCLERARKRVASRSNANWIAGADGEDGRFELMIATQRRLPTRRCSQSCGDGRFAEPVLVWDPADVG
jgi:hypothetical protein